MSDTTTTSTAVALAHDSDTYVVTREKRNKDGTIARITTIDSIGILRSGSKAERCEMADSAMQRAIAACNYVSALHNMRRVWPMSALARKRTEPLAGTIVGTCTYLDSGYQFVTYETDDQGVTLVTLADYDATSNKAATALLYARAIAQKAQALIDAGKTIKGEKAIVLNDALAVIARDEELQAARAARAAQVEQEAVEA